MHDTTPLDRSVPPGGDGGGRRWHVPMGRGEAFRHRAVDGDRVGRCLASCGELRVGQGPARRGPAVRTPVTEVARRIAVASHVSADRSLVSEAARCFGAGCERTGPPSEDAVRPPHGRRIAPADPGWGDRRSTDSLNQSAHSSYKSSKYRAEHMKLSEYTVDLMLDSLWHERWRDGRFGTAHHSRQLRHTR